MNSPWTSGVLPPARARSTHVSANDRRAGHEIDLTSPIRSVSALAPGHPVWLVTFDDVGRRGAARQCVLKVDDGNESAGQAALFVSSIMGEFSPGATLTLLTSEESNALEQLPAGAWDNPATQADFIARYVNRWRRGVVFIYKMPFHTDLHGLEGASPVNDRTSGSGAVNDAAMRVKGSVLLVTLLPSLKSAGNDALYRLGKITVVDLFTGNMDRILCGEYVKAKATLGLSREDGMLEAAARADLRNSGNVIFRLDDQNQYSPIGLDFYDPTNTSSTIHESLTGGFWVEGELLKSKDYLAVFASNAIKKLNQGFLKTTPTLTDQDVLDGPCILKYRNGLIDGVAELGVMLRARDWPNGRPRGIADRMHYMGWI